MPTNPMEYIWLGIIAAQAIYTAANLRIPDLLSAGPKLRSCLRYHPEDRSERSKLGPNGLYTSGKRETVTLSTSQLCVIPNSLKDLFRAVDRYRRCFRS